MPVGGYDNLFVLGASMPRRSICVRLGTFLTAALIIGGAGCMRRAAPAVTHQLMFVTLPESRAVAIFPANASGDAQPLATIRESAPDLPVDASIDLRNEVFIANANGNIKIYAGRNPNDYRQVRELGGPHTGMEHVTGMAVDLSGDIFIADQGIKPGEAHVLWFAAALNGNILPVREIIGPHTGLTSPEGIAIDSAGETFVVDRQTNRVLVFAADAEGDAAPVAILGGLNQPRRVFVDGDLNVYVTNHGDDSLAIFVADGPQHWTRNASVTSPAMRNPDGVTADSAGRIAVAVPNAVLFFGANASGSSTPKWSLQGPAAMNPATLLIR